MTRRRTVGIAAAGTAAMVGTGLGVLAATRAVRNPPHLVDPEWAELHRPLGGQELSVESFDGTVLHAEVLGPPGAPVVVLAHGYVLSLHAWHYQRRDLHGEFRVVAYDQRGHGRSQPAASGDYSMRALGADLAAVLDAVTPSGERAFVAGHSMGGMAILSYAREFPESVPRHLAGAALLDTTAVDVIGGSAFSAGSAMLATVLGAAAGRAVGLRRPRGGALSNLAAPITRQIGLSPGAAAAHVAFTQELALACPREVSAAVMPALTALDVREAAPRLRVPTLVLVGALDRLTPPAASRELARLLPEAELVVLPGVGHMAPLEAHGEVSAHLRAFARRCLREAAA